MDKYFTIFDQKNCGYTVEYNPGDIMSQSSGRVTAEEWKILKDTYTAP